jgi:hypothetical protein
VVILRAGCAPVEFFEKQLQLIGAQLLTFGAVFGSQQLPQQALGLVQLGSEIDEHLLQDCGILRQAVAVDQHCNNFTSKCLFRQAENISHANIYLASRHFL